MLSYSFYYDFFFDLRDFLWTYIFLARWMILLDINSTVLAHASIDFRLLVIISLLVFVLRCRYTRRWLITVSVWYPDCRIVLRLAEYNVLRNAVAANLSIRSIVKKLKDVFYARISKKVILGEEQFVSRLAVSRDSHDQFGQWGRFRSPRSEDPFLSWRALLMGLFGDEFAEGARIVHAEEAAASVVVFL